MRRTVRMSPAAAQLVRETLSSKLMLGFVIVGGIYYVLMLLANMAEGGSLFPGLISVVAQGLITAESIMLYQRQESRNLKQLSVFCLIGMIVMLALCVFLGAVVLTLNREYSAQTEEIMQLWADAELADGMPYMIATVAAAGLNGVEMLFLWKAFGMSAEVMERRSAEMKNWFLPAAVTSGLNTAMILTLTVLWSGNVFSAAAAMVSVAREGLLTALLAAAAMRYKSKLG